MRKTVGIVLCVLLLAACRQHRVDTLRKTMTDSTNGVVQRKEVNGFTMQLMYMPQYWHRMEKERRPGFEQDSDEMDFRLRVLLPAGSGKVNNEALQYGLDTVFRLVVANDTLGPLYAQQVQDGGIHGLQYLLAFERRPLQNGQQATLVFNDRLFSNTRVQFHFNTSAFQKIDSLSARL